MIVFVVVSVGFIVDCLMLFGVYVVLCFLSSSRCIISFVCWLNILYCYCGTVCAVTLLVKLLPFILRWMCLFMDCSDFSVVLWLTTRRVSYVYLCFRC